MVLSWRKKLLLRNWIIAKILEVNITQNQIKKKKKEINRKKILESTKGQERSGVLTGKRERRCER